MEQINFDKILSETDILIVIKNIFKNSSLKLINYNLKNYSEEKLGFLSIHKHLQINIKKDTNLNTDELNFFAKIYPFITIQ